MTISDLLELLRGETAGSRMEPPGPVGRIPTLQPKHPYTASPQLAERFLFAGRWENVILGTTWLSLKEMESSRRRLAEQVNLRADCWPRSAPALFTAAQLSVFAIDEDDQNETYLVWDRPEPRVFEYFGGSETIHRDFRAYLRAHLQTALALGSNTARPGGADGIAAYLADETSRLDRWVEGLSRYGQVTLTRAAIASARLMLPLLESSHPDDRKPHEVLRLAEEWVRCPCDKHGALLHRAALAARPISPALSGGAKLFEAGHAICYVAYTAVWLKLTKPLPPTTRARLEMLVGGTPAEVARLLNAERLPSPSGAPFTPATAKSTLARLKENLDAAATWAGNTASTCASVLGKPKVVRAAIRAELAAPRRR